MSYFALSKLAAYETNAYETNAYEESSGSSMNTTTIAELQQELIDLNTQVTPSSPLRSVLAGMPPQNGLGVGCCGSNGKNRPPRLSTPTLKATHQGRVSGGINTRSKARQGMDQNPACYHRMCTM
eukprot:4756597-Amphidinium_carterae.1